MAGRRLLIVDDSAVIRRALTASLSRRSGVEVVGSASNGRIALMKIPLLRPDVVALDVVMPEMDGLETLAAVRQMYPRLHVIMLNIPTPHGAAATVEALTHGASDYVMKPDSAVPTEDALQLLGEQLMAKIELCAAGTPSRREEHRPKPAVASVREGVTPRVDVVAIGVSTGGPRALRDLLSAFSSDFPVPILIVQHMPPTFTRLLADRLAQHARLSVAEARPDVLLQPGHVWIAPGDFHLAVERDGRAVRMVTHREPPENSCRPSVDVLFRSVARVFGRHALAVVMTGMGQDGVRGCEQVRTTGGQVLVQDEGSSVVWGMPGAVARAGIADQVLPLSGLGLEIAERVWRHRQPLQREVV